MKKAAIFDFNSTLFDPSTYKLYPGVADMLDDLRDTYRLFLYSRRSFDRGRILEELGIEDFFEAAYFAADKTPEELLSICATHKLSPAESLVIGDALSDELSIAHAIGAETVWLKHGIFSHASALATHFEPTHTVHSIGEMHKLLRGLKQ